jgi:hypothetical protein
MSIVNCDTCDRFLDSDLEDLIESTCLHCIEHMGTRELWMKVKEQPKYDCEIVRAILRERADG